MRALIAFILCLPGIVNASDLALKRLCEQRFDGTGWSVYPHGSKLVALNKQSLRIEVIDAANCSVDTRDNLDSHGGAPRLLETLSDAKGEFLVTLVRDNNIVELHALDNNISWEVKTPSMPMSLQLVEGKTGDVYLVVATRFEIGVYRRNGAKLETVRTINSKVGYKQVQILRSNSGLIVLSLFDRENAIHAVQLDVEGGPHEHVTLGRPEVARAHAYVDGRTNDYVTALVSKGEFRFYVEGEKDDSEPYSMDPRIFTGQWIKGLKGRALFAAANRDSKGDVDLTINDPYVMSEPVTINAGRALAISEVGNFTARGKMYYYFVKDHHVLNMHADDENASITFKDNERVQSVQVFRPAKALAVLVENPKSENTRLQMIVSR